MKRCVPAIGPDPSLTPRFGETTQTTMDLTARLIDHSVTSHIGQNHHKHHLVPLNNLQQLPFLLPETILPLSKPLLLSSLRRNLLLLRRKLSHLLLPLRLPLKPINPLRKSLDNLLLLPPQMSSPGPVASSDHLANGGKSKLLNRNTAEPQTLTVTS